ncbi:MAG TPA: prepilin-type N-terminal cleavage/methylation domain-containing protein [Kiritimatiellia bacterium]|nr:prepilin-type N-terminal cleavage/methylation domain-containing protein [Kiritimatiellia bacterium]
MNAKSTTRGFTLVELLAAILAGAVIVLVAGAMLWHSQTGLRRLTQVVDVHRDMRAGMDALTRITRAGTGFTFTTGLVYTVTYTSRPPARIYASTSNLFFIPNLNAPTVQERLANGTLKQFNVTVATNQSVITLVLESPLERMSNRVTVVRRN